MNMNYDEKQMRRLEALKEIAELLNEVTDLQEMLEKVLHTLLQVMNLQTGWIFLLMKKEHIVCLLIGICHQHSHGGKRNRCVKEIVGA